MAKTSGGKKLLIVANILFILGLAGVSTYLFIENRDLNDQLTLTTEEKNKRLVEEINKVFDLPDEEPVVAVVTNPDEFKSQYSAFDNAQQGDYLLFYRKARLNVLYRQDEKRVVKTANVVVPITIELVGSEDAIADAEKKLADFGDQITIVKKVTDGITQAFVFDVDNDQAEELKSIADVLEYEIGSTLPASIVPSEQTEIIIVVTKDVDASAATVEEQP
jgi:hypothetical protein